MFSTQRFAMPLGRLVSALLLSFFFTTFILLISGAPPLRSFIVLFAGGLGSVTKLAQAAAVWVPLALCSSALLLTFAPDLWNIGVEGQVILGAICATGFIPSFPRHGN